MLHLPKVAIVVQERPQQQVIEEKYADVQDELVLLRHSEVKHCGVL
tara:strand:+ start:490 stop:627 length:138 start_codon:yes stop_codon:yes gene_type:complete